MISFLTCKGKMTMGVTLTLSYQDGCNGVTTQDVVVAKDAVYKITFADNVCGLRTLNGRITNFTLRVPEVCPEMPTSVDLYKMANFEVDTITVDYSEHNQSQRTSINVGDIRSVELLSTSGLDEIVNPVVPTFH